MQQPKQRRDAWTSMHQSQTSPHHAKMYPAVVVLLLAPAVSSLIGYDCGGQGLNITTLSLTDIGTCELDNLEPESQEVYLQLMQLSDYDKVQVTQCLIEIDRTIFYCGMHSHISIVHNGRKEYVQEIGSSVCQTLQSTGAITLGNAVITGIPPNRTTSRAVTLAGTASMDGRCSGSQYSDGYGTWDNVVVQASVKITLRNLEVPVKRTVDEILLPSGARCPVNKGYCMDADGSETFWPPAPVDSCHFDKYDILYEGLATRLTSRPGQSAPIIYTVTTQDTTFALTKTGEVSLCGYKLTQTEHPKLFILETQPGKTFKTRSKISVDNLDIFSYVNSKFVYVEKHIKTQLTQLYRDIMEQKCALERQILQNALSLSSVAPDEMAFRIMKSPGYTAVTSGEVIYLIRCIPVECKLRHETGCYNELPVTHRNVSFFLLPRSRILVKTGTPRDCSELLPPMYNIHGTWFRLTPKPVETLPPPVIHPLTHPTWKYVSPSSLATSGIYTTEDLDRLRNHIMFPVERPSMLNTLARGAMGQSIPAGSVSMLHLLDEASLEHIAESAGQRLWHGFMTFGSVSAGVIGVILVFRLAKLVIDTIIHGYALHSVYGWSIHLLGAVWSSVTHLLLHLAGMSRSPPESASPPHNDEDNTDPTAPPLQTSVLIPAEDKPTSTRDCTDDCECTLKRTTNYRDLRKYLDDNYKSLSEYPRDTN